MVELIHLEKRYEDATPLRDVNTVIKDGDVISVIGPSGTGKSTLLRCINMLERPTGGKVILDGEDLTSPDCDLTLARRKMGMVFQSFNLFGHLTVIENVMLAPMVILKKSKKEAYINAKTLLKRVDMDGREFKYPDQLSGGQKQRVAIARTLAMGPKLILLDEPTSALDPTMVGEVQAVIKDLAQTGKTMMIVTHEMNFARSICNRVFYMDQGGIYEDGTPEQIFDHPKRELTKQFIRQLKILEIPVDDQEFDFDNVALKLDTYCLQNGISPRVRYRIHLAVEELIQQILFPLLGKRPILVTIRHSAVKGETEVLASYGGEQFSPSDGDNEFSLAVLKRLVDNITYKYDPERERGNLIKVLIRE